MTLVIGLKWMVGGGEAIVMASDSRVSVGFLTYEARKIHPIGLKLDGRVVPLAIAGGAGDASLVKQGFRVAEKVLQDRAKASWGGATPSFEEFEAAVGEVESRLISRFNMLREMGVDISFRMILGSVDREGRASLYLFDDRGLAEPVHDNPGFAVIGSGFFTGGMLLLKLLGYSPEASVNMDLGMLASFIIDLVSEVDTSVGPFLGESWLMRVGDGGVVLGPLKERAYKEYKEKIGMRRELFKRVWRLCDEHGEEDLLKLIEKLENGRETDSPPNSPGDRQR